MADGERAVHALISSARRTGPTRNHVPRSEPGTMAMNEIDTHADTICAGLNWKLLELSGEYCSVSPFSGEYQPKPNVPIAKCATVYTCPNTAGDSIVLVADQVLWFGDELHCSLNPHQVRSYGYGRCDDPWDPHRSLGIDLESIFIPLIPYGPNLSFESRVPTDWEMEHLQIIEITAPVRNPADLQMSRPHSSFPRVVNCISTASRDIWTELATLLSAISPSLDCRCVLSSLYSSKILVHGAPTGTANISAALTSERHSSVNFENLSRKWNIGLETAKCTLQVTTQQGIRTAVHPLHRRYRVDHLHLNRRRLNGDWFTDTLFSKVTSIQGNTCAQVYTNGSFITVHPLDSKAKIAQSLTEFTDDVGIPDTLLSDGAPEVVGSKTDFMKEVNRLKIRLKRSEAGRSNQNYAAECEIGVLKKRWRNRMLRKKVPPRLWDYGLIYESNILNRIPRGQLQRTGIEMVTGETPDISEWIDFEFYDRVWCYNQKKIEIDGSGRRLARWLGVAHRVGSDLCYWLLLQSGKVIARTTVQYVVRDDYLNDDVKSEIERFDQTVEERMSDQNFILEDPNGFYIQDKPDDMPASAVTQTDEGNYDDMNLPETPEADEIDDALTDKYLNAELIFDIGTGSE